MNVSEEEGKEMTFHSCLLQALQNRVIEMSTGNRHFVHSVKLAGNKFIKEIDRKLDTIYGPCNREELQQGQELIELIDKKIEEAWKEYEDYFKQGKI